MSVGSGSGRRLRALVIDDSAYNRRTIGRLLEASGEATVVGTAADGEEGLRAALDLHPEVITLDLEMPTMDGFTFLRILMARQPTPVIVISSYARKVNVFRALELGAVDFIPKPSRFLTEGTESIQTELAEKLRTVRALRQDHLGPRPAVQPPPPLERPRPRGPTPIVAIGASTGGPPALQQILSALPPDLHLAMVIAQHMPARFTRAFAERLDRSSALHVTEAEPGDRLEAGRAFVAPGGRRTEVVARGGELILEVGEEPEPSNYTPSIDVLFESLALAAGPRVVAVVLTGMGRDGREGVVRIQAAGGRVFAESEETAVVYGMPKEAADTGCVDRVLPLREIPRALAAALAEGSLPASRGR